MSKVATMDEFDPETLTDRELLDELDKVEELMQKHANAPTFRVYVNAWYALQAEWDYRNGD